MSASATIVIPTFNGKSRVGRTLDALATQQTTPESAFELLIIDNNSTDSTADFVLNHPAVAKLRGRGIACRVVREERQGLLFARIRAVREANAEFICFLDDDNVPIDDRYVAEGIAAMSRDARVGLLVSQLTPEYQQHPSPSVLKREHLFAVNYKLGEEVIDWGHGATLIPSLGAGLWLRRSAYLEAVPWQTPELLLPDRVGDHLSSGNDIEIGWYIGKAGYRRLYWPRLKLLHIIPAGRCELTYVRRLVVGIVRSEFSIHERFDIRPYGLRGRSAAILNLAVALAATPALLARNDGFREMVLVLTDRWARVQGPYEISRLA